MLGHLCEDAVQGTGEARVIAPPRNEIVMFDLAAVVTVDVPGATPNGAGGECYPASGVVSLTGDAAGQGKLVLDVQGSDCALGGLAGTLNIR